MTHNWDATRRLLIEGSIPAFKAFFEHHPLKDVRAIGYTWQWGQSRAAFYAVANTKEGLEKGTVSANHYRDPPLTKEEALETARWEAGYFPYPAGLVGPNDELGAAWEAEANLLHALTEEMLFADPKDTIAYEQSGIAYEAFLADLVTTCCGALADIAVTGLFGDYSSLDFWVGSTDENGDIVQGRDARIRDMISANSSRLK
jgi:hypothetical protein